MNGLDLKKALRLIDAGGLAACLVVTALVFVVGVRPMLKQGAELQQTQAQLAAQRSRAEESSRSLALLREQAAAIEQAVNQNPLRLQPLDQLNARLSLITATAADHGVEVERLEPGAPSRQAHFVTVPIRVGGRGGYVELTRFLHALHTAAPDTAIASVDLRGQPRTAGGPAMFDLELVWHAAP